MKVALLDFDGTLVTKDILDVLCEVNGKGKESRELDAAFHRGEVNGLDALVTRINFLTGMTHQEILQVVSKNNLLMNGAIQLLDFFKEKNVITILASGNIVQVLQYYQKLLGIDFVVGSQPRVDNDTILGISYSDYSSNTFKLDGVNEILSTYSFEKSEIIAIGDSPSDKGIFSLSGFSVAINPKGDIADYADAVVHGDLGDVKRVLEQNFYDHS